MFDLIIQVAQVEDEQRTDFHCIECLGNREALLSHAPDLYRQQRLEGTCFEREQIFPICSHSLWEKDNSWEQSCLDVMLSLDYALRMFFISVLANGLVDKECLNYLMDGSDQG